MNYQTYMSYTTLTSTSRNLRIMVDRVDRFVPLVFYSVDGRKLKRVVNILSFVTHVDIEIGRYEMTTVRRFPMPMVARITPLSCGERVRVAVA